MPIVFSARGSSSLGKKFTEVDKVKMRKCVAILLAGGNWNNTVNAGVSYRNSNNVAANTNRNIGTQLELRTGAALNSILT